jgi:hypothetical protein
MNEKLSPNADWLKFLRDKARVGFCFVPTLTKPAKKESGSPISVRNEKESGELY